MLSNTAVTSAKVSGISGSVFRGGNITDFDMVWRFSWLSEFLYCTTDRSCIETFDLVPKVAFLRIYWQVAALS